MPQHFYDANLAKVLLVSTGFAGLTLSEIEVVTKIAVGVATVAYILLKAYLAWRRRNKPE